MTCYFCDAAEVFCLEIAGFVPLFVCFVDVTLFMSLTVVDQHYPTYLMYV